MNFTRPSNALIKIVLSFFAAAGSVSAMNLVNHNYSDQCGTGYSFDGGFWLPSIDVADNAVPGQYIFQRAGPHGNNGAVTVTLGTDGSVSWSGDFGNVVAGAVGAYGNDWVWYLAQVPTGGTASVTGEPVTTTTACDAPVQPSNAFGTAYLQIGPPLPPYVKPCDNQVGGTGCASCGQGAGLGKAMAQYSVHSMLASLHVWDTPIGYTPPRGPAINFTITYNQREAQQSITSTAPNLGPRWTLNLPVTNPPALGATQLQTVDGPLTNDIITYVYDELGRAVSQSINGVSSSVAFDSLGRPSTSDNPLGHFTRAYESDVTPRPKTLTMPTGQTSNFSYFDNSHDRGLQTLQDLTSGSANVSKFDYTYDPEGQIYPTWVKQLSTSPATTSNLTYDLTDQLTQVVNTTPNNPSTTLNYGYDPASNRTSDNSGTYSINDVNEITNTGYAYDADGNLTNDGVNTYQWDAANRLTTIIYPGTAGRTEFTYDGLGRRVGIVEKNGVGSIIKTSNFVWSGMTIAEQRDDSSNVVKRFLAEGVQLPTGAAPNTKLYYSKDHLGSIRSLTNENGTILGTLDYDAYGGISRAPVPANDTSGAEPVLLSAVSRMTHGSAGTFDVNLPLSGAPGIEMRGGPISPLF